MSFKNSVLATGQFTLVAEEDVHEAAAQRLALRRCSINSIALSDPHVASAARERPPPSTAASAQTPVGAHCALLSRTAGGSGCPWKGEAGPSGSSRPPGLCSPCPHRQLVCPSFTSLPSGAGSTSALGHQEPPQRSSPAGGPDFLPGSWPCF